MADAQRTSHGSEVLQFVALSLLQVHERVRLHHVAQVLDQFADRRCDGPALDDEAPRSLLVILLNDVCSCLLSASRPPVAVSFLAAHH